LPSRPAPAAEEEEEEEEEEEPERPESPPRVAIPVPRGPEAEMEAPAERLPPRPIPTHDIEQELPREEELPEEQETHTLARGAAAAVAEESFGHPGTAAASHAPAGGKRALVQYDYAKAEDNEIDLVEGQYITSIEMVDEDWWMGTNAEGETGLFPSNYVELAEGEEPGPEHEHEPEHEPEPEPEVHAAAASAGGPTATAQFDYEAAEDNELSFPEGATVTDLEFPDEDWWFGHYGGHSGLFPANYVQLDG